MLRCTIEKQLITNACLNLIHRDPILSAFYIRTIHVLIQECKMQWSKRFLIQRVLCVMHFWFEKFKEIGGAKGTHISNIQIGMLSGLITPVEL